MITARRSIGLGLLTAAVLLGWPSAAQDVVQAAPVVTDPTTAILLALVQGGSVGPVLVAAVAGFLLKGWTPTMRIVHVHENGGPPAPERRDLTEESPRRG